MGLWRPNCWWFRNPKEPLGMHETYENPVNNGIFTYIYHINWLKAGFLNHQQYDLNVPLGVRDSQNLVSQREGMAGFPRLKAPTFWGLTLYGTSWTVWPDPTAGPDDGTEKWKNEQYCSILQSVYIWSRIYKSVWSGCICWRHVVSGS